MKKCLLFFLVVLLAAPAFAFEVSDLKFGGQVRMRGYNLQNMWDLDDDADGDNWSVFRLKTSLYVSMALDEDVTGYVRISNQNYGEGVSYDKDNASNKTFVDNAYINVDNFFKLPVTVRIGRQNIMYGSGFVLFDGNSQFASTSIFLDGVKASWHITDKMQLDGLYFKDEENDRDNDADDDITLSGVYFTNKECSLTGAKQEFYILNRKDDNLDKDIIMYGVRISDKFASGLDYSAEVAIQKGDFSSTVDQDALGYKLDLGYTVNKCTVKPRFYLGYAALSGDEDPNDSDNESWDVFYGGWPQFGDLLAWRYLNLGGGNNITHYDPNYNSGSSTGAEAVYSNIEIATIGASAVFFEKLSANISYSLLTADETINGIDDDLGDYYQLKLKYKYSKALSFAVYAAMIDPGDTFDDVNNDNATEVYWEADLRF